MSMLATAHVSSRAATLWLASSLVLFAALAPALGITLRTVGSGFVIEICTSAAGQRSVGKAIEGEAGKHGSTPHCPLCVLAGANAEGFLPAVEHSGRFALTAPLLLPFLVSRLPAAPRLFAQTRAPPSGH